MIQNECSWVISDDFHQEFLVLTISGWDLWGILIVVMYDINTLEDGLNVVLFLKVFIFV